MQSCGPRFKNFLALPAPVGRKGTEHSHVLNSGAIPVCLEVPLLPSRAPSLYHTVYQLTARIPAGAVATYGQLALLAGRPRASRIVGGAMARAPAGLPCHRVVYGDGRLSPPDVFGGPGIQRMLLEQEGVPFLPDGRVDLSRCQWDGA